MNNYRYRIKLLSSSKCLFLFILITLFLFIGCNNSNNSSSSSSGSSGDTTRPTVVASDPSDGQIGVAVDRTTITVQFSERMDVNFTTITGDANWTVDNISFAANGIDLSFGRSNAPDLPNDTLITITLTDFRDEAGNFLNPNPYTITFRTIP